MKKECTNSKLLTRLTCSKYLANIYFFATNELVILIPMQPIAALHLDTSLSNFVSWFPSLLPYKDDGVAGIG